MDVVLLSRMIGELMPELDSLSLPGLGTFRAESMPATFSDKGYTINPPYRRLTFSSKDSADGLLAGLYASSNGISAEEADTIIRSFTAELAEELRASKSVELPGLGRLRATREDHFFFVQDQDLDISPEACGLVSVSLKSHVAAMPSLPDIPEQPAPSVSSSISVDIQEGKAAADGAGPDGFGPYELTAEPAPAEAAASTQKVQDTEGVNPILSPAEALSAGVAAKPEAKPTAEPTAKPEPKAGKPKRRMSPAAYWAIGSFSAAVLLLGGFIALSRLAPDFTDKLLYTQEQLAIINAPEDGIDISR